MRFIKISFVSATIMFFTIFSGAGHAQQPMPKKSGFGGYVELLGAYFSSDSQLNTDNDNRRTDSLDDSGKRVSSYRVLPLGLVNYTFAEARTQLYLGILPENVAQGQFQVEGGVRHWLENGTQLRAAFIPITPFQAKTWEDPFVVGQKRSKTDVESYGLKVAAETIFGTGLNLKYGFATRNVDDEKSGTFLSSLPGSTLTPQDLNDIDRDANFHRLTAEYAFRINAKMRLKPGLRYTRGDADGNANSFNALRPELTFSYFGNPFQLSVNAFVRFEDYDDNHPVFDKTRHDDAYGLFAILGYRDPFGLKKFRIDWFNFISRNDSNINFYESTSYGTALGFGYTF